MLTNFVTLFTILPEIFSFQIMVCCHSFKKYMLLSLQVWKQFVCLYLLLSGCVKRRRKLPCVNTLFWVHTLTRYLHCVMSTWGQYENSIAAWLHHIRIQRIQVPGRPTFLTLLYPPTLENSTNPTKNSCSSKHCI